MELLADAQQTLSSSGTPYVLGMTTVSHFWVLQSPLSCQIYFPGPCLCLFLLYFGMTCHSCQLVGIRKDISLPASQLPKSRWLQGENDQTSTLWANGFSNFPLLMWSVLRKWTMEGLNLIMIPGHGPAGSRCVGWVGGSPPRLVFVLLSVGFFIINFDC